MHKRTAALLTVAALALALPAGASAAAFVIYGCLGVTHFTAKPAH
jgi:hypothetical protein